MKGRHGSAKKMFSVNFFSVPLMNEEATFLLKKFLTWEK